MTGNPVRASILGGDPARARAALRALGVEFDEALPTVYVTGGAQGSQEINNVVAGLLEWLLARANVIHQAGPANVEAMTTAAAPLPAALASRYHVTGFVEGDLVADVLALSDVVISRSGAGTVAELTAVGRAAVLLPLASSAGGEQAKAARILAQAGAAVAVCDGITVEAVRAAVAPLLTDPARREAIAARARELGHPDAAKALAQVVAAAGRVPAAAR
ncbi:UDP-N-acetylglucosamine--N-acetylmuramyl-(pentapeptide) pyrophosphoryl-undecaprenol N-acetylglucosamine transferase [Nocardia xishanensis]